MGRVKNNGTKKVEEKNIETINVDKEVKNNEETKKEVKKQEQAVTTKNIFTVIKSKDFKETLEVGSKLKELKEVVDNVKRYIEHINKVDVKDYVRYNYSIYNTIKNIVNDSNYNSFSVKFRFLINVLCKAKKEGKINELTFLKYDYAWTWGGAEYTRFSRLITLIFTACDNGVKKVAKMFNLDRATSVLSNNAKNNLKRFF